MRAFFNYLLTLLIVLHICSCKTQSDFKKRIYNEIDAIDNNINNKILPNFGTRDSILDSTIKISIDSLNKYTALLKNHHLRRKIKTYSALSNNIILLHEDKRMNYPALGQILGTYTQIAVDVKEKLAPYK